MVTVGVIQSNYIPWKGYFDIINDVDLFIFYDDVQYTKNDWRNRNQIKTSHGPLWLTIPTGSNLSFKICDVELPDSRWAAKHWKSICQNYTKAPYFNLYKPFFEEIYLGKSWLRLSDFNQHVIRVISTELLGIKSEFRDSRHFDARGTKQERLLDLLVKAGAEKYVSGPSAKEYIDVDAFSEAGIKLIYKDYSNYPRYRQFHPPFTHYVSIIDLLFHEGPHSPYYIWGWRHGEDAAFHLPVP